MGSVEMVKLLLSVGADASLTSTSGDTAYDIAVQEDRKDIIPLIPNLKSGDL
jgi:ankyrin repeat protein